MALRRPKPNSASGIPHMILRLYAKQVGEGKGQRRAVLLFEDMKMRPHCRSRCRFRSGVVLVKEGARAILIIRSPRDADVAYVPVESNIENSARNYLDKKV